MFRQQWNKFMQDGDEDKETARNVYVCLIVFMKLLNQSRTDSVNKVHIGFLPNYDQHHRPHNLSLSMSRLKGRFPLSIRKDEKEEEHLENFAPSC